MLVHYERPYSYSAHWARRIAYFSFILLVAAWIGHRFGPVVTPNFLATVVGCVLLSGLALLLALIGFISLWRVGAKGGKASFAALVLVIPVLAPAAYGGWLFAHQSVFWEVSTDLIEEPKWIEPPHHEQLWLGTRKARGDGERQAQFVTYPALIGHRYDGALDRVVVGARNAAAAVRLNITLEKLPPGIDEQASDPPVSEDEGTETVEDENNIPIPEERPDEEHIPTAADIPPVYQAFLQGETTSFLSGLQYDFVIRLREEEETTLADIRVAARYGQADMGGSARIAAAFLKALDAELLGIAGD